MSKKRDPVVTILEYFQAAELPLAELALSFASAIVKRRKAGVVGALSPRLRPQPVGKKPPSPATAVAE